LENARLLDARLRKIISEVSIYTGREIKKNLLQDIEASVNAAVEKNFQKETVRMLALLRSIIENL